MCVFRNYKGVYYYESTIHILHPQPTVSLILSLLMMQITDSVIPHFPVKLTLHLKLRHSGRSFMEQDDWVKDNGEGDMP